MKLRKAIFVTVLMSGMLAVVDACLYALHNPGFTVLTGVVMGYGILRGAYDFCMWLYKPSKPRHVALAVAEAPGKAYDWADDEEFEGEVPST